MSIKKKLKKLFHISPKGNSITTYGKFPRGPKRSAKGMKGKSLKQLLNLKGLRGETEAGELSLYIANDRQLYDQTNAIKGAIGKHFCKGNFSQTLAEKGFKHVVDAGARKYAKEFGTPGRARDIFSASDRKVVAKEMADSFKADINLCITKPGAGWCDNLPPKIKACAVGRSMTGQGPLAGRGRKKRRK